MEDLCCVIIYTHLLYLALEELVDKQYFYFVFLVAKVWSFFLNFSQYVYDQTLIWALPVKVLASQYECMFSYYVLMLQVYETTGVCGVIFVTITPILAAVYLWHNVLLPSLCKKYFPKYYKKHYTNNSSEFSSIKKPSFFKKWFK